MYGKIKNNLPKDEVFNILAELNDKIYHSSVSGSTWKGAKKLWESLTLKEQAEFNKFFPKQHEAFLKGIEKNIKK